MRAVTQAVHARAMSIGGSGGADGGYGVPLTLDPSHRDHVGRRAVADPPARPQRVRSPRASGPASAPRASPRTGTPSRNEVSDDAPTLAQPRIKAERASAFVEASLESSPTTSASGRSSRALFADAKNILEATAFLDRLRHRRARGHPHRPDRRKHRAVGVGVQRSTPTTSTTCRPTSEPVSSLARSGARRSGSRTRSTDSASPTGDEPPLFNADRSLLLAKPWNEISDMSPDDDAGENVAHLRRLAGLVRRSSTGSGWPSSSVPHTFGSSRAAERQQGLFLLVACRRRRDRRERRPAP